MKLKDIKIYTKIEELINECKKDLLDDDGENEVYSDGENLYQLRN